MMIESNIEGGTQAIPSDLSKLKYGCSVTDPCIDWPTTEAMVRKARTAITEILPHRIQTVKSES
jgi:3-deoxy-7-phosphoheptulonate synthase